MIFYTLNASSQVDFPSGKDGFSQSQTWIAGQTLWDRGGVRPGNREMSSSPGDKSCPSEMC